MINFTKYDIIRILQVNLYVHFRYPGGAKLPGRPKPNFIVKHIDGYVTKIFISPTVLANINSADDDLRNNARNHICVKVRKSFYNKYPQFPNQRIEWIKISMIPIDDSNNKPTSTKKFVECDDCPSCDQGYHDRCTKGCSLGIPWNR